MLHVLKSPIMATIGQILRRERELRGISLEEISNSTKISMKLLEALEQDRMDILPGEFYIKAILRTYAKSIGLEENEVINMYYEASLLKFQLPESQESQTTVKQPIPKRAKKIIGWTGVAIIFLIILTFVYLTSWKKDTAHPQEELINTPLIPKETPVSFPELKQDEPKLLLEISFIEETWLQVYTDGDLDVEAIKRPGETVSVEAYEELLIHLGNAGGITYRLNNREGKPLGPSGTTIRNIRITLENIKDFLAQELESLDIQKTIG
jgi:transcriptional regulator with XRE-family HTH domain